MHGSPACDLVLQSGDADKWIEKGNIISTEATWNENILKLRFSLRLHWLLRMQRVTICLFFLFFPPHFPSLCLCRWAVWPRKGERAVPVVSVQQRQRQGAQSVRQQWEQDWLVESIAEPQYGGAGTVQVLHVCVCVSAGWECKVVWRKDESPWDVIKRVGAFYCSAEDYFRLSFSETCLRQMMVYTQCVSELYSLFKVKTL